MHKKLGENALIFDSFREAGLPLPEYRVDETSVTVVVPREYSHETSKRLFSRNAEDSLEVREEYEPAPNLFPESRKCRSSVSFEDVWSYIRQRKNVTFSQMLADLDVGRRTLAYRLEELKARGLIVRTGNTRSAVWNAVQRY